MATRRTQQYKAYGFSGGIKSIFPEPKIAKRDPSVHDQAEKGQTWVNDVDGTYFVLTAINNGESNWLSLVGGGGTGTFSSLTVSNDFDTLGGGDVTLISNGRLTLASLTDEVRINSNGMINFGAINDTQAVPTVTINATVGIANFTGFTIGSGATQDFTINSSEIASDSGIIVGIADTATAATEFIAVKQTRVAGTLTVTVLNTGVAQTDGDITISFIIL